MKLSYAIDDDQISEMNMTIHITMTVNHWRELMRTKSDAAHYQPLGRLQTAISQALGDLSRATEKKYEIK